MTKRKYQELLVMRKSQEKMLFELIRLLRPAGMSVRDIARFLGIPKNRAVYILCKWIAKGYYDYGVTIDLGWLTGKELL